MKKYTYTKALLLWTTCLSSANIVMAMEPETSSELIVARHEERNAQRVGTVIPINNNGSTALATVAYDAKMVHSGGRAWGVTQSATLGTGSNSGGGAEIVFASHMRDHDISEFKKRQIRMEPPIDDRGNCTLSKTQLAIWWCDAALIDIFAKEESNYYLGIRDLSDTFHYITDGDTLTTLATLAQVIERNKASYESNDKVNQAIILIPPMIKKIIELYRSPGFKEALEKDMATILVPLDAIKTDCERYIFERNLEARVPLPNDSQNSLLNIEGVYATDAIQASIQLGKLLKMIQNKATLRDHSNAISNFFAQFESLKSNEDAVNDLMDISGLALTFGDHKTFFESEDGWTSIAHLTFNSFLESVNTINRLLKAIEGYLDAASTVQFSLTAHACVAANTDVNNDGVTHLAIVDNTAADAVALSSAHSLGLASHFNQEKERWKLNAVKEAENSARRELSKAAKQRGTATGYAVSIMGDLERSIDEANAFLSS